LPRGSRGHALEPSAAVERYRVGDVLVSIVLLEHATRPLRDQSQ